MKFNEKWMLFLMASFVSFFGIVDTLLKKTEASSVMAFEFMDNNIKFDKSIILDYQKKYILYLDSGITVKSLMDNVSVVDYKISICDKNNKIKSDNFNIFTGDKLVVTLNDEVKYEFIISVMGDYNGDGVMDVTDLLQLKKYVVGWENPVTYEKLSVDNVNYYALDLDMNGLVDLFDLDIMNKGLKGFDTNE